MLDSKLTDPRPVSRRQLTVTGRVQGVGFRPFAYRLALELGLVGSVKNTLAGVNIDIQGPPTDLDRFGQELVKRLPPLAAITSIDSEDLPPIHDVIDFHIVSSIAGQTHQILISPDVATCLDCLNELFDPNNRRHLYPFINCTNCGPRYTIIRSVPYDRSETTMACFPLCEDCRREYEDPINRRFHTQPNACPACGPQMWLVDATGAKLAEGQAALRYLAAALLRGNIAALKGVGGFHLCCDARNHIAVAELRQRKHRPDKPLAVLVADLNVAHTLANISTAAATLLTSWQRPIVLCNSSNKTDLPSNIAPNTDSLGLMLPSTPLHYVLLYELQQMLTNSLPPALIMTSGNTNNEPIILSNREALRRLTSVADLLLLHNRDIIIHADDSVAQPIPPPLTILSPTAYESKMPSCYFLRQARGYTPAPVFLQPSSSADDQSTIAVGSELKNTICLTKSNQAFISQYIGNLKNLETFSFFEKTVDHLLKLLRVNPTAVVRDLHPNYLNSYWADNFGRSHNLPVLTVQHHVAHLHAALAEHRITEPAIGLALDGTGLGEDGTLWGGELFFINPKGPEHIRLARFAHLPLPGGETAIRQPWRIAQAALWSAGIRSSNNRPWPWLKTHEVAATTLLPQLLEKKLTPLSSGCGRLFDAIAGILGLCLETTYEGQAAILLENAQGPHRPFADDEIGYYCPILTDKEPVVLDTIELIRQAYANWLIGIPTATISRRFHVGLVAGLTELVTSFATAMGTTIIACSGGAMQNLTLATELPRALSMRLLTPYIHHLTPPNDSCIALGQAAWARLASGYIW